MADFEQLEANSGQEPDAFNGLLAALLTQWEEQDLEISADAEAGQEAAAMEEPVSEEAEPAPVESTLAQLSQLAEMETASETGSGPIVEAFWPAPEPESLPAGIAPVGVAFQTNCEEPELMEETSGEECLPVEEPAAGLQIQAGPAGTEPAVESVEDEVVQAEPEPEPEMAIVPVRAEEARAARVAEPRMVSSKTENMLQLVRTMYRGIQERKTGAAAAGMEGYVVVRLAGHQIGIPTRRVVETDRLPRVTPLPFVPDFIPGVANLRGEVLPLVDLRLLLGLEPETEARMVVVRPREGEAATALVVDGLGGIAWLNPSQLSPVDAPVETGERVDLESLVSAAGRHRDRKLEILDLDRLFASRELAELRAQ
jgi:purine-binding chemotaxis protein CheW